MENKIFETEEIRFEVIDSILHYTYKKGAHITTEKAKQIVAGRRILTKEKIYPLIAFDEGFAGLDRGARQYFASEEGIKGLNAAAFVANSIFNKYLIDFFLSISFTKKTIPTKVFSNKKQALQWIEQFK